MASKEFFGRRGIRSVPRSSALENRRNRILQEELRIGRNPECRWLWWTLGRLPPRGNRARYHHASAIAAVRGFTARGRGRRELDEIAMKHWRPCEGLRVNPGRARTRRGGDEVLPFLDVPHWFALEVIRVLRHHRVEFDFRPAFDWRDSDDPDQHADRLVFKKAQPAQIQYLVDSVKLPGFA
jgi:hypothetical protein